MIAPALNIVKYANHELICRAFARLALCLFAMSSLQTVSVADIANNSFGDFFTDENLTAVASAPKKQKPSYKYYNEKKDKADNVAEQDKNYAKIGVETYSQPNIWKKYYVGLDLYWQTYDLGDGKKNIIAHPNFWRRFQNLNVVLVQDYVNTSVLNLVIHILEIW